MPLAVRLPIPPPKLNSYPSELFYANTHRSSAKSGVCAPKNRINKGAFLAEAVGFEPTHPLGSSGFQDHPLKPLEYTSKIGLVRKEESHFKTRLHYFAATGICRQPLSALSFFMRATNLSAHISWSLSNLCFGQGFAPCMP